MRFQIAHLFKGAAGMVHYGGAGKPSVTAMAGSASGTICVTATNGVCVSGPSCIPVTAKQVPSSPVNINKN